MGLPQKSGEPANVPGMSDRRSQFWNRIPLVPGTFAPNMGRTLIDVKMVAAVAHDKHYQTCL